MTEEEFWKILQAAPESQPVSWRLYYDAETGRPIQYSMEDLPGNYIEVDPETYTRTPYNIRVVNGQIKYITTQQSQKLVPADLGTACDPRDVAVVVDNNQTHQYWKKKTYDQES